MSKQAATTAYKEIRMGFEPEALLLRLEEISPLKVISAKARASEKFEQIVASIREVGVIEPPVVAQKKKAKDNYMLLDGHLRIEALKLLGRQEVMCLISTDDEAFTYNKHISRISPVQEHRMILQAIKRGVSEEKIARALNLNVANIIRKRDLLEGICPEAVDLIKDKMVAGNVFAALRRMKATRQIEAATLMNDAGMYSVSYVNAILAATPKSLLANPDVPKKVKGLTEEQMARMEAEMDSLHSEYRLIEDSHGTNVLNLTVARSYLSTLLENARVSKYLSQHHPEFLTQFKKITAMVSLGGDTER